MKKVLLFLSLALFLSAGIVTAKKVQSVNANSTEIIVSASDLNSIVPLADEDDKTKKTTTKATKENCSKENCTKENCNKENCKESCDKGLKAEAGKEKCAGEAKTCCSKDKGKK
ncbi:MAG: hypothetical protein K9H16_06290 [Bacteroidales bacterium]|nr:hypothetical protein [Bacteroidales bacterium]